MQDNGKYQFVDEIKVELKDSLDKIQAQETEELKGLIQLKKPVSRTYQ